VAISQSHEGHAARRQGVNNINIVAALTASSSTINRVCQITLGDIPHIAVEEVRSNEDTIPSTDASDASVR